MNFEYLKCGVGVEWYDKIFLFVVFIVVDLNSVIGMNGISVDIYGVRLNVIYKYYIDIIIMFVFVI